MNERGVGSDLVAGDVPILYVDRELIGVLKPEGLATIAERDPERPSLHGSLQDRLSERLWIVHRLDKDVSGAVVFARTAEAHRRISRAFEMRQVEKRYIAVVHGVPDLNDGRIDRPIRAFGSGRMGVDDRRGKASVTRYRVLDRFGGFSLLEVSPLTGRRHQIRVHLYHAGHPIAGDPTYGEATLQRGLARLMLHAASIVVPGSERRVVRIDAPPTESFEACLRNLRTS